MITGLVNIIERWDYQSERVWWVRFLWWVRILWWVWLEGRRWANTGEETGGATVHVVSVGMGGDRRSHFGGCGLR